MSNAEDVAMVRKKFEAYQGTDWRINLHYDVLEAYYNGDQNVFANPTTRTLGTLTNTRFPSSRDPNITFNFCKTIVDQLFGMVTQKKPGFHFAAGRQQGSGSRMAAKVMTRLFMDLFDSEDWERQYRAMELAAPKLGSGACQIGWTMDRGPEVYDDEAEENVTVGMPFVRYTHPSHIHIPRSHTDEDISKAEEILIERVMSIDQVKRMYGKTVPPESDLDPGTSGTWLLKRSDNDPYEGDMSPEENRAALILEYWRRPNAEHPEGQYIVSTRKQLLYSGRLPYEFCRRYGILPFIWLNWSKKDKYLRGDGALDNVWEINYWYNRIWSEFIEYCLKASQGVKVVVAKGHGIDPNVFDDPDRLLLEYAESSPHIPQVISYPNLPYSAMELTDKIVMLARAAAGAPELLGGENPDMVRGYLHLASLQENNKSQHSQFPAARGRVYERGARMILWLLAERMPDELGEELVGKRGKYGWRVFKEQAWDYTKKFIIDETTMMGSSPLVNEERALNKYNLGLYGEVGTPEAISKVNKVIDSRIEESSRDDEEIQVDSAEYEDIDFMRIAEAKDAGEQPEVDLPYVLPTDDHIIHILVHKRSINENRGGSENLINDLFAHISLHEDDLEKQQMGGMPPPGMEEGMPMGPEAPMGGPPLQAGMTPEQMLIPGEQVETEPQMTDTGAFEQFLNTPGA